MADDEQNVAVIAQYVLNHIGKPVSERTDQNKADLLKDMLTLQANVNRWLEVNGPPVVPPPPTIPWLGRLIGLDAVVELLKADIERVFSSNVTDKAALSAALEALKAADIKVDAIEPE
jgi:hypothetical protein